MRSLSLAILVDFLKTQRFRESSLRLRQYTIRYSFYNCINIAKVSFYNNIYTFIILLIPKLFRFYFLHHWQQ